MQLYLDTANVELIRKFASTGAVAGVTTNPSLIAREGRDFAEVVREIAALVDGPVSAEVISTDHEGMLREARELAKLSSNVVIKIPMTVEGLKAVNVLSCEGIPTNVTLVFTPNQALLAARAGASYVSPFVGRLDDIGQDGIQVVKDIAKIYSLHGISTKVIAASIRHPEHVRLAALAGAHIATIPPEVFEKMFEHPLTAQGIERFLRDWNKG